MSGEDEKLSQALGVDGAVKKEPKSIPLDDSEIRMLKMVLSDIKEAERRATETITLVLRSRGLEGRFGLSPDCTRLVEGGTDGAPAS